MNDDIRPPKRTIDGVQPQRPLDVQSRPAQPVSRQQPVAPRPEPQPTQDSTPELPAPQSADAAAKKPRRRWRWVVLALGVAVALVIAGSMVWYARAQRPVQNGVAEKVTLTIEPGTTPDQIASQLKSSGLIRSELAFSIYTRLAGVRGALQAGDYRLAPTESLAGIVDALQQGQSAEFSITFYPGATLYDPTDIEDNKRTDVYTMLVRAGYSDAEVRAALEAEYDHPLLASKPNDASLEGYVYGDTYQFSTGASIEDILTRTFDEFYDEITERDLLAQLKKQDLTLHEGIILGSIIEREVSGRVEDQKQVSQIFHLRLDEGMTLGADATFMYAAQQANQTPTIDFDSPYNTRINAGLPPGPIASVNITALDAAANPASGDYLFFVSGDDGTTHYARTQAEHDANTQKYCTDLCYSIE